MPTRRTQDAEVTIDTKGGIRLPDNIRQQAGLNPGDRLAVTALTPGQVRLTKTSDPLAGIIGTAPGLAARIDTDTWQS